MKCEPKDSRASTFVDYLIDTHDREEAEIHFSIGASVLVDMHLKNNVCESFHPNFNSNFN